MTSALPKAIVVLHAFGPYSRGEMLTDPAVISAIINGGHASMAVSTQLAGHYPANITVGEEH